MSTRATYRQLIGGALGRFYYVKSTTTAVGGTTYLIDKKRTEEPDFWNGGSCLVNGEVVPIRGGQGIDNTLADPQVMLDFAASGAIGNAVNYELVKGWTFDDLNASIDHSLAMCYPYIFTTFDLTVAEITNTADYDLTGSSAWRHIAWVKRQWESLSPTQWWVMQDGFHYDIERKTDGTMRLSTKYAAKTGVSFRIHGDQVLTLAAADASTSFVDDDLVVAGALAWLFQKGSNADEAALSGPFKDKAAQHRQNFEMLKRQFAIPREQSKVKRPRVDITNEGTEVPR